MKDARQSITPFFIWAILLFAGLVFPGPQWFIEDGESLIEDLSHVWQIRRFEAEMQSYHGNHLDSISTDFRKSVNFPGEFLMADWRRSYDVRYILDGVHFEASRSPDDLNLIPWTYHGMPLRQDVEYGRQERFYALLAQVRAELPVKADRTYAFEVVDATYMQVWRPQILVKRATVMRAKRLLPNGWTLVTVGERLTLPSGFSFYPCIALYAGPADSNEWILLTRVRDYREVLTDDEVEAMRSRIESVAATNAL